MGKIQNFNYIKDIGIKKVLCRTNMGNTIYILNNGKKYKEFNEEYRDLKDSINREFQENLLLQTEEYDNSIVSFPEIVISSEEELFGIVGDYEIGIPLLNIDPLINLGYILGILETLEQGIESISKKGWNLEDIHEENILINRESSNKPIRIIDTDYHTLQLAQDRLTLYQQNLKRIFNSVITSIIPSIVKSDLLNNYIIKQQYILASNGFIKPSEFIRCILLETSQKDSITIKTLQKSI